MAGQVPETPAAAIPAPPPADLSRIPPGDWTMDAAEAISRVKLAGLAERLQRSCGPIDHLPAPSTAILSWTAAALTPGSAAKQFAL